MKQLRALSLEITNVLGIDEIKIDLSGNIIEISGANGQGKTSCIEALKSVLTSADSGTLLRNGAANGRSVLILSDGSQIVSALKPGKSSKRAVFDAEGHTLDNAPTRIAELFDTHSLNPVDFLNAKGKIRIDLLLEAMPIVVDAKKLNEIAGPRTDLHDELKDKPGGQIDGNFDGLLALSNVRGQLYDFRTGDNRVANENKATIKTLQQSLAGAQPFDADRLIDCKATTAKLDEELGGQITKVKQAYAARKSLCDVAINSAAETKLALKQAYEKECRELDDGIKVSQQAITHILTTAKDQIKVFEDQNALKRSATNTEIELLEAAQKAFEGQQATRLSIQDMEIKVEINEDHAAELTKSIKDIDAYKAELLADMPIKGLSIDGDKLMLDGVLFDRVNTAKRVGVAMKLAELRAGKLKLILADGLIDIMDNETREEFYRLANESDCQFVVTKVTDGKLMATQPPMTEQEKKIDSLETEISDLKSW